MVSITRRPGLAAFVDGAVLPSTGERLSVPQGGRLLQFDTAAQSRP